MKIELQNVTIKLGQNEILSDINLSMEPGHIYGIVGRNGSGKSILLKTICGFITPLLGSVKIDNIDIYKTKTFPSDIGALIDKSEYLPEVTCLDNLKMLAAIQNKIGIHEIIRTVEEVNLLDDYTKKFKICSLGTKQKVGIAQAIMEDPKIIILDEPFNGIDIDSVQKIKQYLLKKRDEGHLIIISTHIKDDITDLCDITYKVLDKKVTRDM